MPTNHVPHFHISIFLEHLQGWWLHHLPGQLCHCITTLSEKKFFLISNLNPLIYSLIPNLYPLSQWYGQMLLQSDIIILLAILNLWICLFLFLQRLFFFILLELSIAQGARKGVYLIIFCMVTVGLAESSGNSSYASLSIWHAVSVAVYLQLPVTWLLHWLPCCLTGHFHVGDPAFCYQSAKASTEVSHWRDISELRLKT